METQQQVQQPNNSMVPEPKKSWISAHHILGYVFLFAVLAAIVSGVYYWQTVKNIPPVAQFPVHKDATAGWKTYTNANVCYSIKYNSPYKVFSSGGELANYNIDGDDYERGVPPNGVYFQIGTVGLENGQNFSDAMADFDKITDIDTNVHSAAEIQAARFQRHILGNIQYFSKVLEGPGGVFEIYYAPGDSQKYFTIFVWGTENDKANVDLMLASFTPSCSSDTSTWKTYTNTEYGFEIKYPSDWTAKANFNGSSFQPSVVTLLSSEALKNNNITSYQKDRIDFYVYNSINDLNNPYRLNASNLSEFLSQKNNDVMSYSKSIFNGLPAYDVKLGGEGSYFAIFFENNTKIYEIFFNIISTRKDITLLENQILSTFKFTK